jgi:hypothetical protein
MRWTCQIDVNDQSGRVARPMVYSSTRTRTSLLSQATKEYADRNTALSPPTKGRGMHHTMSLTLVAALAAALQSYAATAQQNRCQQMCRAIYSFKSCDKPLDGAKVFSARVIGLWTECSDNIVRLRVEDAKANTLPDKIEIDLGACQFFSGKVGDVTQIALAGPHSSDARRYHLACSPW